MSTAELDRVREFRKAARIAVQADDHPLQDRYLALIDLAEMARAEPDPLVRRWSELAIWEESRVFLGMDDEDHEFPPQAYEARQHALRAEGYSSCPRCLAVLATDIDFDRWRRMRAAHIEEMRVREQATDA